MLVGLSLWLARLPLADLVLSAALSERGLDADFQVVELDLNRAVLTDIRFGSEASPDASVQRIDVHWRWTGLSPAIELVRLTEPHVRLRLDRSGAISAGSLSRLEPGPPSRRRPSLPRVRLEISGGQAVIEAPFGPLVAAFNGSGRLGEDFSAVARLPDSTYPGDAYALTHATAELIAVSRDDTLSLRLSAQAHGVTWGGARIEDASLRASGEAPLDLARINVNTAFRIGALAAPGASAVQLTGLASAEARTRSDALEIDTWTGQARATAGQLGLTGASVRGARFEARAEGEAARARGRWVLGGERFDGFALASARPAAAGRFFVDASNGVNGDALITLAGASLTNSAQHDLREAIPNMGGTPLSPTFTQAEHALDRAADSFTLSLPVLFASSSQGLRLSMTEPAEARAATGARLRLSPLRQDSPSLLLNWPGPALQGAVALELSGGGAPNASLLLDSVLWAQDAPFEADGTLALSNWSAAGASIAADELNIGISVQPHGVGRIDLRGPAHVTGPLGDGQVRDMVASLDLGVSWGAGWRVTPNGCVPVRVGGLDAVGLSFSDGAFSVCALGPALIAADAHSNLSGGFSIERVALNGRMSGPDAQPARLSARTLVGRFRGRPEHMTLALEAANPTLAITMAEDRTLNLTLHRVLADATFDDSWRIEGAFEQGALADPALPGSVSTIAGSWSAAPEDGKAVIRVSAGEALLTANRPASEDERPLFNPLRLINVNGVMREGRIGADGDIVLAEDATQLAHFTAEHGVGEGIGRAQVIARALTFSPTLQPYDITERARGMVENVRGPIDVTADINWSRADITGAGLAHLDGLSLATATIPIVQDVRGDVFFDNLFELTTPPGQNIHVGVLNPGVAVSNGRVRFQLLDQQRVSIESAEFDFAAGTLAMSPATITLGADETRFELTLRQVDATALLESLSVPDLEATGQLEGSFPLRLTRQSAYVEHGVLRATGGGGTLSYTGQAGANATGMARVAFDALRSFRYDVLSLTLDGDINGDVVSSIEFSGHNSGQPVDLGPIAPVPGLGNVQVRGVPFDFNVRVAAPFRRLAQTAASITDPGAILNRARQNDEQSDTEVDIEVVDPTPEQPR
ncbi:MAG: YdbH domain-containing protein [Hyphomonadaceae bacterium]|nr:YdbH domain-containing protein [Hyphomonadaceae bacterium]